MSTISHSSSLIVNRDNTKQAAQGEPGYDMNPLIQSFQQMFIPQQQLSIDEAMISFKGRLSFLQYLPKKPKKVGDEGLGTCRFKNGVRLELKVVHWQKR